ncbi:fasciclin domain-containing protein [Cesiribacter andamanensis]|uniref:Immunogenic protein MPT70 n=1 Tax=Cesiribacter andamanensis AMV16 TaxID=1279009 RepID=M7N5T2_9BACT|nr:fasciclin domain-containing protein [Cesiribacter andamanensis]EMR02642.1 Immunogenic protein MPT70 precursor [Cesiribacter andamanensis AMV16]
MKFLNPTQQRFWLLAFSLLLSTAFLSSCDDDDTGPMIDYTTLAQRLQADPDLSTLASILSQPAYQDLMTAASDQNASLTIFAPTNTAFSNLVASLGLSSAAELPEAVVREVLEYHIVPQTLPAASLNAGQVETLQGERLTVTTSGGVQVDGIAVTQADIEAINGVVHKIGGVLLPAEPRAVAGTILAPAYFNSNFSILVQALRRAGLVAPLLEEGPFTVFAPTNDAFAAAGITSLEGLTAEDLQPILLYHVVEGDVRAADLTAGAVPSLGGEDFYVSLNDNGAFINGNSQVVTTDVVGSNGVVHVINRTLMPPSQNLVELVQSLAGAEEGAEFTQLLAAVLRVSQNGGADLVAALSGDNGGMGYTVFAPTDAAFQAVYDADNGINSINDIPVADLQAILLTHVVGGRVFSADLADGTVAPLQSGQTLVIDASTPAVGVQGSNEANINAEASDVLATNGVVHVIDAVLLPAN